MRNAMQNYYYLFFYNTCSVQASLRAFSVQNGFPDLLIHVTEVRGKKNSTDWTAISLCNDIESHRWCDNDNVSNFKYISANIFIWKDQQLLAAWNGVPETTLMLPI